MGWVFVTWDWPALGRKSGILTACPLINDSQQWLFVIAATKTPLISTHHFPVHTVAPQLGITAPITAREGKCGDRHERPKDTDREAI